ncbi:TetR family transcriptional regulator [Alkanindiges sp. WGS2144]|uniref:TetR family transcriptional regulator n=1 Tax=Alkanindiges sp. WGS2144 TaxID=3366808 RepID=UPI0037502FB4
MSIRDERKQQSRQALLDAALSLSTSGRSFSMISLREVAREAGLVPTAFYRHFQDMEELGRDLVDQVAISLHYLLRSLREGYTLKSDSKTRVSIERFFAAVDQSPRDWQFLVAERWGGSPVVRDAIAREVRFFIDDLAEDFKKLPAFAHVSTSQDLQLMASILINLAFSWVMSWLNLPDKSNPAALSEQHEQFIQTTIRQAQLLFRGISNWNSEAGN